MNILFITQYQVTPYRGGIERITDVIVNSLQEKHRCFSAYLIPTELIPTKFVSSIKIDSGKEYNILADFIKDNKIDIIINQQCIEIDKALHKLKKNLRIKTFFFQHDIISEPWKSQLKDLKYILQVNPTKNLLIKYYLFPLYRSAKRIYDYLRYKKIYNFNDKVLLLSGKYTYKFLRIIGLTEDYKKKIAIINNCVTLPDIQIEDNDKENIVLIVSRMTESRKRILLALDIWKRLNTNYPELSKWKLVMVGDGDFLDYYKQFSEQNKLRNIVFLGQVESTIPIYKSAKIFMMTSHSEGWGLTIMEAQQMGVVPIGFNSYPAIEEIIDNGKNGFLINEGEMNTYVEKLAFLMKNPKILKKLSWEARTVSKKYSVKEIINQWEIVINS